MTSYSKPLTPEQADSLRALLHSLGFEFKSKPHTLFAASKEKLQIAVYQKGPKILVQGKGTEDFVRFTLEPEILGAAEIGYEEVLNPEMFSPHLGIDESGKGDFFGPLVIAGVFVDAPSARLLLDAGIMDSKRVSSDRRIRTLAQSIRDTPGIDSEIVSLGPERYNHLYAKFGNLNRLLAWGHAQVIESLLARHPLGTTAISDQFAHPELLRRALGQRGKSIDLRQRHRAEADVAVAAASILARQRFIDWLDETGIRAGVTLPKGAAQSVIDAGVAIVTKHGRDALQKTGKLHFRTASEILSQLPP